MRSMLFSLFVAAVLAGLQLSAQAMDKPYIGYVYPAGGQQGASFEVKLGGENIYGATSAIVSGKGVAAVVVDSKEPEGQKDKNGNKPKRKKNQTVIDEIVTLRITIAADAEPGSREICLAAPGGLTNKRTFQIGQLKEVRKLEAKDKKETAQALGPLPVLINGQILPGGVDKYKFSAKKGQRLVIEVSARALIPYIADAVPGWFQAILFLYDSQGKEVAVADSFRFSQDPVLFFDVPADDDYTLAIRDSIYRGRLDFVYRIKLGELPFITGIFPLGAQRGETPAKVKLFGRNLPVDTALVAVGQGAPAIQYISVARNGFNSNLVPFTLGELPEVLANEAAARQGEAQTVNPPAIINGCIRLAGEKDSFCFEGKKDQTLAIEVLARRLGSPLDSYLILQNSRGKIIAENDDMQDKSEGLLTHIADSEIICKLPEDDSYTVKIFDTENNGGSEYAYRLRIGPPELDFALRITPSALSVPPGGSAPITIHAIRKDGFAGEIKLALDESASGLTLDGAVIPEGADKLRLTVSASDKAPAATLAPALRGTAMVNGKPITHAALPAEELMQAFIYQHLVPFKEEEIMVGKQPAPFSFSEQLPPAGCLKLPLGKEASFSVSVTRRPGFDGPIRLQLVDPPKDISLKNGFIPPGKNSATVTIKSEGKIETKLKENLILTGTMVLEKPDPAGNNPKPDPASNNPKPDANKAAAKPSSGGNNQAADGELIITKKDPTPPPAANDPNTKAPPSPPAAGKGPNKPPVERITVTLPAVPFRIVDNQERKNPDAGPNRNNH